MTIIGAWPAFWRDRDVRRHRKLRADGFAAGGRGGRVAVFYDSAPDLDFDNATAAGGSGAVAGEAGTVVVEQTP